MPQPLHTPLHPWHIAHGGRMVEFGGWSMPVQYTSIVDEHHAVRQNAGLFDISHMGRLEFSGTSAEAWIEHVTTNHVAKLKPGQIQYSLVTNIRGGIVDDVLVYRGADGALSMVCNASNRTKVIAHFHDHKGSLDAGLIDRTADLAMIAVQGPAALDAVQPLTATPINDLKYYYAGKGSVLGVPALFSRTGYTGEDGIEIILSADKAVALCDALLAAPLSWPVVPCGLGARDTLRFEAAMPLYGHELTDEIDPFEAGVGWAVKLGKGEFVGRAALVEKKARVQRTRVGVALAGKRIAREGAVVTTTDGARVGTVTSGTFGPTLNRSLAMALIAVTHSALNTPLTIDIRGHQEAAQVVPLPFYRRS